MQRSCDGVDVVGMALERAIAWLATASGVTPQCLIVRGWPDPLPAQGECDGTDIVSIASLASSKQIKKN